MLNIICNPLAGKKLAAQNIKIITKYLKKEKVPYLVFFSEKAEDIGEFASSLYKNGEREFIIVGGDGTIHRFLNAVPDLSKINFGIIPSGINNCFARSINIPLKPVLAIQNILNNNICHYDYFKCNDITCCSCASIGAIEYAKHQHFLDKKKDATNLIYLSRYLKAYEPIKINIKGTDIKEENIDVFECYIANGMFKDNLFVSPLSNLEDGLLNINCITQKSGKSKLSEILSIKRGKHIYNSENLSFWAPEFKISCDNYPVKAQIDGELYELEEMKFSIIETGLNIFNEQ